LSRVITTEPEVASVADAAAPLPVESAIVTVGADVYPLPGEVSEIAVIAPPETVAVAAAPDPPPPDNVTVGLV
jgi:hypothetical protein